MRIAREIVSGLLDNFRDSLKWASVQMMAAWGVVWVIYAQLPPDVMQAVMTYLARVKQPKAQ
jgi:hypothetical protein